MIHIDLQLRNAWIKQIKQDWKNSNYSNFKDRMKLPNIDIIDSERILGRWEGGLKRKISISSILINNYPWQYVQEVLYHEMAHQFVDENMGIRDALPHGDAFRMICKENSIDHSATGDVCEWAENRNNHTDNSHNHKILDKIQKLLSLAQSSNPHEAELAMAKAQEFLLKHNLSLLELDNKRKYIHKQIGEVGRRNPTKSIIGTIISEFFFVEALWVFGYDQHKDQKGRVLEIYGTPENIELAEYVHDYLHNITLKLWSDYKLDKKPDSGNKHRRTFIYGLLNGFYQKLETKVTENESKSLIWKGDPYLNGFFQRRNPKIRRSSSNYRKSCQDTYNSGFNSGKNLVIHKGIKGQNSGPIKLLR